MSLHHESGVYSHSDGGLRREGGQTVFICNTLLPGKRSVLIPSDLETITSESCSSRFCQAGYKTFTAQQMCSMVLWEGHEREFFSYFIRHLTYSMWKQQAHDQMST